MDASHLMVRTVMEGLEELTPAIRVLKGGNVSMVILLWDEKGQVRLKCTCPKHRKGEAVTKGDTSLCREDGWNYT